MAAGRSSTAAVRGLRVRVLGGFAVEGIDERALGTRKARLLLKRLAVAGGRPVAADEIAAAVVFVCSPAAAAINGSALRVEGGCVTSAL